MKMMTMEDSTAPPTIPLITGRDLPLPTADIPWLALPVPIPHKCRIPSCLRSHLQNLISSRLIVPWRGVPHGKCPNLRGQSSRYSPKCR
jgi:hypothetical protein